jgi:hypothetical protein
LPTEIRHIIFEPTEVVQAVKMYQIHMGTPLPPGNITNCSSDLSVPGKVVRFYMTVVPDPVEVRGKLQPHQAPERFIVTEGPALAAALLLFCRKRAIPMAAKAEKKLELMGKKVCLVATLSQLGNASAESAPPR